MLPDGGQGPSVLACPQLLGHPLWKAHLFAPALTNYPEPGYVITTGLQHMGTAQAMALTWGQVFQMGSQGKTQLKP